MNGLDWLDEDEWYREYRTHFIETVLPALDDSAFSISIAPTSASQAKKGDVKYWTELGASIMLDKPIILIVEPGYEVPTRLRRAADAIVEADITTPRGQQQASEKIAVAVSKLEEELRHD